MAAEVKKVAPWSLQKQNFKYKLKIEVVKVEDNARDNGNGLTLHSEAAEGGSSSTLEADIVVVAFGRTPFTEGFGQEELGVKVDKFERVGVDHSFKTSVLGVYAISDVNPSRCLRT